MCRKVPVTEPDTYLAFALEALQAAGQLALRHFRQPVQVENKQPGRSFDPVTQADRDIETFLRERIMQTFPGHGIEGEEFPPLAGQTEYKWVIDPVDGTRAFISGFPAWGILLALLREDEPVLGLMHQPFIGETFYGDGKKAWVQSRGRTRPLTTSGIRHPAEATLYCTHPEVFSPQHLDRFERLAARVKLMRYGGDCYIYCLLAHGFVDLTVEDGLKAHDILPLIPIVQGAGGFICNQAGEPASQGGLVIAAATRPLQQLALEYMQ